MISIGPNTYITTENHNISESLSERSLEKYHVSKGKAMKSNEIHQLDNETENLFSMHIVNYKNLLNSIIFMKGRVYLDSGSQVKFILSSTLFSLLARSSSIMSCAYISTELSMYLK